MKQQIITFWLVITLICLFSLGVSASVLDWNVYETDNFVLFYPEGYKYQAEEVLYYLEEYQEETMNLVGNERNFKTLVVLQNAGLESYGGAVPLKNKINLFTNNPSTLSYMGGLEGYNSWFKQVSIHEFTHLAQVNNASGLIGKMTYLAGNQYSPNNHIPRWLVEGIAVYNESRFSENEGRLNNGYYESFITSRAKEESLPDITEISYSDNQYIYGAQFVDYLANRYGEEKLTDYFREHSDNLFAPLGMLFPALGIDDSAEKVYGESLPELFADWKTKEQNQNKSWTAPVENIVQASDSKIMKLTKSGDKLYYIKNASYTPAPFTKTTTPLVVEYDLSRNSERIITQLNSASNASLQAMDNKLYYATRNSGVGVLYEHNLETGSSKGISVGNFKDFTVLQNGDIIYTTEAKDGFGAEIWRYNDKDEEIKQVGRVNQLISEIASYKDQFIVVSKQRLGSWNINYLKQKEDNNFILEPIVEGDELEKLIKIVDNKLYFTANYNRKYAVYQYNLTDDKLFQVTNVSYAVDGIADKSNLYFVGVHNEGEGIYKAGLNLEEVSEPDSEKIENTNIDIDSRAEEKNPLLKNYSYLFKPYIRFPYLEAEDALGKTSYQLQYLNDFNTILTRKGYNPYKSLSVNNFEDELNGERKNDLYFSYESYPWIGSFAYGEELLYLDLAYRKEIDYKNSRLGSQGKAVFGHSEAGLGRVTGDEGIKDILAVEAELDYTHKLFSIQEGIWNPNLFLGNLYGRAFIRGSKILAAKNYDPYYPYSSERDEIRYYCGYEFLSEVLAGFRWPLVPRMGFEYYFDEGLSFKFTINNKF